MITRTEYIVCPDCEGDGIQRAWDGERELCDTCVGKQYFPRTNKTGRARKEEGMEQVLENHAKAKWLKKARTAMLVLAFEGKPFTSDDLRMKVGAPPTPNLIGAIFSSFAKEKLIHRTDNYLESARPEAHARRIPEWTGGHHDH